MTRSLLEQPFHPDRDGCDCSKRGLMDDEECLHDDPCWTSRAAYEDSVARSTVLTAESIARRFHELYERLAPNFGYETRPESAVPWEAVPEANRNLMVAVVDVLLDEIGVNRGDR